MEETIKFSLSESGDVGYIQFLEKFNENDSAVVKKQLLLRNVVSEYAGSDIYMDFDANNKLIGIEILLD